MAWPNLEFTRPQVETYLFYQVEIVSIGTLVAYIIVAIAVLVTRYTPLVKSVTEGKGNTKKTKTWLQSICCCPGETEGQDDLNLVGYHQVQNNDEDSSIGTTQPHNQTNRQAFVAFRVRVDFIHNSFHSLPYSC